MYVQLSVHVKGPMRQCADQLERGPRTWFPGLDGDGAGEVGLRVAGVSLHKKVRVDLGEPERRGDWINVPISWKATFPERLFPVLTGRIELAPVDPGTTRMTFSAMYEPPLGKLGALVDQAVMHRVAEATVRELAESIALQLGTMVEASDPDAG